MSERLALIVAASEFHDRRFRRLRAPALDAKQLSAVLKDSAVGRFTDVRVVLNQPRQVIEEAIEALFANRQPGDLTLLYFSCHGITDRHGQLRFVTTPTRFDRLGSTTVSSMFVKDQMELSRARSKVVLLDCCHGGAFARGLCQRARTRWTLLAKCKVGAAWSSPPRARSSTPSKTTVLPVTRPSPHSSPALSSKALEPGTQTATEMGASRPGISSTTFTIEFVP